VGAWFNIQLPWCCITCFGFLLTYQLSYHLLDLIIFVVTLVLHWGGRSFWTSGLQFDSGHFSGSHNSIKISWWVHMTFCCCPTQLSVSAACFIVFWMGRTTHGVDCSCMQYNLEVGKGGGTSGWLLLNANGWRIPFIYLFSYVYYIQRGPSIYPMYLSTFLLKSAVWQDLPYCQIFFYYFIITTKLTTIESFFSSGFSRDFRTEISCLYQSYVKSL
jgi:hypothetical protein